MDSVTQERPQYCDIVMKGGITSGVVYPLAAVELARNRGYEFRNVGGTSAGAIAAVAVAAAEFGRRSGSNPKAYDRIDALPDELGRSLTSLFQPSVRMRPLFDLLLSSIGSSWRKRIVATVRAFPAETFLGALPGFVLLVLACLLGGGWALKALAGSLAVAVMLAGAVAAILAESAQRVREMPDNFYGLCPGNDRYEDAQDPPLTRWLTCLIDDLARKPDRTPLTFGDLWDLPPADGDERGLNLQVMTTSLSQGRPYSLPFEAGELFWFDPVEFLELFPRPIVDHMVGHSPGETLGPNGKRLFELPRSRDLPVVVAARLSLSFPGLICAVPLYAINHASKDAAKIVSPVPERCWFSDGGITSNFPVHFFDSPVPRWPTFAINLEQLASGQALDEKDQSKNVWLPKTNSEGTDEAWAGWEHKAGISQLTAFASSIFRTAQNWIDNRQMRGAGYRDRIAHVWLTENEGGMNLKMEREQIERLAERGACAAGQLAARFGPNPPAGAKLTWDNQKWVRYRAYLDLLEKRGQKARRGFLDDSLGTPLAELRESPPSFPWAIPGQGRFADETADELVAEFAAWDSETQAFSKQAPAPPTEPWSIPRV
jgi:predicted acylesterase/phospholipase RssA